jgi:hypothetical protein
MYQDTDPHAVHPRALLCRSNLQRTPVPDCNHHLPATRPPGGAFVSLTPEFARAGEIRTLERLHRETCRLSYRSALLLPSFRRDPVRESP